MVLSKIKKMNKFVQAASTSCVDFNEMANLLSEELKKPTMVVAKNGRLLGKASWEEYASDMDNINVDENDSLDKEVISVLSKIDETKEGLCKEDGLDILCSDDENGAKHTFTAVPIYGMGERLATLLVVNDDEKMADDDLVMCEHAATLMAMEMITSSKERIAEEVRRKSAVQMAIGTLSYRAGGRRTHLRGAHGRRGPAGSEQDRRQGGNNQVGYSQRAQEVRERRDNRVAFARNEGNVYKGIKRKALRRTR